MSIFLPFALRVMKLHMPALATVLKKMQRALSAVQPVLLCFNGVNSIKGSHRFAKQHALLYSTM